MSSAICVYDAADRFIADLPVSGPLPEEVLKFALVAAFPDLAGCEFTIRVHDTGAAYAADCAVVCDVAIDQQVLSAPARTDPRMCTSFFTSEPSTPSNGRSPAVASPVGSSPLGSPSLAGPIRASTRRSARVQSPHGSLRAVSASERGEFQRPLRELCLVRDRRCIISGDPDATILETVHLLKNSYALEFFARPGNRRLLSRKPARSTAYMDARNAVIMDKAFHKFFDLFKFSIWPADDGTLRIYGFDDNHSIRELHGKPVRVPVPEAGEQDPDYFIRHFPAPEVFREHFKCAVLYNMRGAVLDAEFEDDDNGEPDTLRLPPSWSGETAGGLVQEAELKYAVETMLDRVNSNPALC